jgi:hypothetical protein
MAQTLPNYYLTVEILKYFAGPMFLKQINVWGKNK